ncbi:GNAT domain-containing protein [Fimicolochytrium jonesii]|uniref:GNAT domain-containing protein n=1 Tax=Fimicolochytrium jonesii TaxID=1396493 RepID=UPI0022FE4776|nr:GNAT domain-containing protein [Fimicolochytrium jonesii]KAI8822615.1 GNAT domain-containing protein [Fimicolochytrium jonesii]
MTTATVENQITPATVENSVSPPPLPQPLLLSPKHTLLTPRLLLRPATYTWADIEAVHACLSDPECMTWWSTPPHESLQVTAKWLWGMVQAYGEAKEETDNGANGELLGELATPETSTSTSTSPTGRKTYLVYPQPVLDLLIVERSTGEVIGKAGAFRPPEIGYILRRSAWGKGYATEALRGLIDAMFSGAFGDIQCDHDDGLGVRPLSFVFADVDPRNTASLRVLGKLGFEEVGRRFATYVTHIGVSDSVDLRLYRPAEVRGEKGEQTGQEGS